MTLNVRQQNFQVSFKKFFVLCHHMNVISAPFEIILLEFHAYYCLEPSFLWKRVNY